MRETGGQIAAGVAEAVDAELLRALGEVAGIRKPTLSPVGYGEVQLTVGCSDESSECLAAITHIAEADAIVVRHLFVDADHTVALRILYFDEAGGPTQVQIAVLAGHEQDLAPAVPNLVRKLFEISEPAAQGAPSPVVVAPAPAPLEASPATASTSTQPTDGGPSISTLTWVALAVGAATVGTGVVLGVTANSDYSKFKNRPVATDEQADDANKKFSSIATRGTLANVLIPAGAIMLGAGAVLLAIDLSSNDSDAQATHARLQMIPLPSGGAVTVHGRFGGAL